MKKALTTVVTHEYFNKARAMIRSFLRYNEGYDVVIYADRDIGMENVQTVDINQPKFMRYGVSQFERIEMIRPSCHLDLLDRGYDAVLYCDSDIYFTGEFPEYSKSVFTPHNIGKIGKAEPHWVINDGFINIGIYWIANDDATGNFFRILDNMSQNREPGYNTKPRGGYWQQCLYNYLPWFHSDYLLSNDESINVAYWNAKERNVSFEEGRYLVNGKPMTCYHFSGFAGKDRMSAYDHSAPPNDALKRLYNEYEQELRC